MFMKSVKQIKHSVRTALLIEQIILAQIRAYLATASAYNWLRYWIQCISIFRYIVDMAGFLFQYIDINYFSDSPNLVSTDHSDEKELVGFVVTGGTQL